MNPFKAYKYILQNRHMDPNPINPKHFSLNKNAA